MRRDRLKEIRELRELSQRELARRCGFSEKQVFRYESGENDPSADHIGLIARELQVTADYLLGLVDEPTGHFQDRDLSAMERKLIMAVREGRVVETYEALAALSKSVDQPAVPPV